MRINHHNVRFFYGIGLVALLSLLVFWRPLQRQCLVRFLLRSVAPSPEVLAEVVDQSSNPAALLKRFWQTQRFPHRHFVLSYLGRTAASAPTVFGALEQVVLEAASDPDIETRQLAFTVLTRAQHPDLRRLALEQLTELDPAARVLGLQILRTVASSNDVPIAVHLLDDPEPRAVVAAALVLRQITGKDGGIKLHHALPQFIGMGTNPPAPPDLKAIAQGVNGWKDWWREHHTEYPGAQFSPNRSNSAAGLKAGDFGLRDLNGRPVRLSDYRGKAVLLAFWSPDSPASLDGAPDLALLQQVYSEGLAVLGICVPPVSGCGDEHETEPAKYHQHNEETSPSSNLAHVNDFVHELACQRKITYPMLLDSKGIVGLPFCIENLPTYVLLDAQGTVRRRFVGNRNKLVWEAMIDELTDRNDKHVLKSAGL